MSTPAPKVQDHGVLRLILDYAPLLVFFGTYKLNAPGANDMIGTMAAVISSTGAFMVAIVIAALIAKWKLGRISPMMWLTTILVMGFGGLTLWFHDAKFIQIKPTIIYALLASLLLGGLAMKRPLMKYVFEAGYDGLDEAGWLKLSRNWGWFFAVLAVVNEILRKRYNVENGGFDVWLTIKVWGVTIISFLFAAANIPMLLKHGLGSEDAGEEA